MFHSLFGGGESILVLIGDPKQSIYGFRGVGLQAYKTVRSSIPPEDCYRLETNYRSRPPLVEAANRLFLNIFRSSSDASEPVGFDPVMPGLEKYSQFLWPSGDVPAALLCPTPSDGEKTRDAMARSIVNEIRAILDPSTGAKWQNPDGDRVLVQASDIAVLVRSRTDEENILGRLRQLGIPSVRLRSNSVFRQETAASLQTLLEAFETPRRTALWRKVLLESFFRVPPSLLDVLERRGRLDELAERGEQWKIDFEEGRAAIALDDFFRFFVRSRTLVCGRRIFRTGSSSFRGLAPKGSDVQRR